MDSVKKWLKFTFSQADTPSNWGYLSLNFAAAIIITTYLEIVNLFSMVPFKLFSANDALFLPQSATVCVWFIAEALWWLVTAGALILFLTALGRPLAKTAGFILSLGWIVVLGGLFNFALTGGRGINYFALQKLHLPLYLPSTVITTAKLVALPIIFVATMLWLRFKKESRRKVTLSGIGLLLIGIIMLSLPDIIRFACRIFNTEVYSSTMPILTIRLLLILGTIEIIVFALIAAKKPFMTLMAKGTDINAIPLGLCLLLGIVLCRHLVLNYLARNLLSFILGLIVIAGTWLITRLLKTHPRHTGLPFIEIGLLTLLSLICAMAINFICVYLVIVILALSVIVFCPPWELEHLPLVGHVVNAVQFYIVFCAGWHFGGESIFTIPVIFTIYFLLAPALCLNCFDLTKLHENNLVTFLGLEPAKTFCAVFTFSAIAILPFVFLTPWLSLVSTPLAILGGWLCLRKKVNTSHIIYLFSATLAASIIWFIIF